VGSNALVRFPGLGSRPRGRRSLGGARRPVDAADAPPSALGQTARAKRLTGASGFRRTEATAKRQSDSIELYVGSPGVRPAQAAKSHPLLKVSLGGAIFVSAVVVIASTPGILISRLVVSCSLACWRSSLSSLLDLPAQRSDLLHEHAPQGRHPLRQSTGSTLHDNETADMCDSVGRNHNVLGEMRAERVDRLGALSWPLTVPSFGLPSRLARCPSGSISA
jgi:hypothetical protein